MVVGGDEALEANCVHAAAGGQNKTLRTNMCCAQLLICAAESMHAGLFRSDGSVLPMKVHQPG